MDRGSQWLHGAGQRIRHSPVFIRLREWLSVIAAHPWYRTCRNALLHALHWLVGSTFEDEVVTFSKRWLIHNDTYRDRLLAQEIGELVDLCEALGMTIPQRKAFFQCFLHLDYMRRAGVSRTELLRYCNVRLTPATERLLPSTGSFAIEASSNRSGEYRTQRWDVLQLLSVCFSLCTLGTSELLAFCVAEANQQTALPEDSSGESRQPPDLSRQISACLAFAYGILSPVECNLEKFLLSIYDAQASVDFRDIHNAHSIVDIVKLFPVLLFPCVWTQRVIKRRVLGEVTWEQLRDRRIKLQNAGLTNLFVSSTEIVAALATTTRSKSKHTAKFEKNTVKETTNDVNPSSGSTPRKILPVENPTPLQNRQFGNESGTWAILGTYRTADDAWRVTADSALATAYCASESLRHQDSNLTLNDLPSAFERMRIELEQRTCSQAKCETTRQFLVQAYGYQFATYLFEKSSLAREALVPTAALGIGARKQTLRAKLRYEKAWYGGKLVEDKAVYWKEYTDPLLKRVFYHNIRTGESRWEQPSTFKPPKPKRTSKRRQTPDAL